MAALDAGSVPNFGTADIKFKTSADFDPAILIRAEACLALNKFDEAISGYTTALEAGAAFGPQVAEAYLRRAEQREANGDTEGAKTDRAHAEALKSNPFGVP